MCKAELNAMYSNALFSKNTKRKTAFVNNTIILYIIYWLIDVMYLQSNN